MPKLVTFRGDAVESEIRLAGNTVRVGRHSGNDVVLDDGQNGVSRFHAEIRPEGNTYCIVDLNSRNGVWINGRRIRERATLALGVPVTVGAFELALEDDVSTTDYQPIASQPTVVTSGSTIGKHASSVSGTRPGPSVSPSPRADAKSQVLLWSAAAAALVLVCVITYVVVRSRSGRPVETVVATAATTAPEEPPPPPAESAEEAAKKRNEQDLADARALIAEGHQAEALADHLGPLLERDPENTEALNLKGQIEQALAASAARIKAPPKPEAPPEPEIAGITRRPNELYADYQTRARRIQTAFSDGRSSFDKQDYATALAHFRFVDREQPRYQGVDLLIADATALQQKALDEAITSGQLNEQANKLKIARQWYQQALVIDPGSTVAKEKYGSLLGRLNAEATTLYNRATFAVKSQDTEVALRQYQQILDLMFPGDEIWEKARKESEALKR